MADTGAFDRTAHRLKAAGFNDAQAEALAEQAEAIAEAVVTAVRSEFATKDEQAEAIAEAQVEAIVAAVRSEFVTKEDLSRGLWTLGGGLFGAMFGVMMVSTAEIIFGPGVILGPGGLIDDAWHWLMQALG